MWVDHNGFNDGEHPDSAQPVYFGRPFVIHDGAVDITNASDLATVSWNRFDEHDKVMLIGSSDGATADIGKLRVTVHHNVFDSNVQRTPRVRFGQVHVYNNYYVVKSATYGYSWGVGRAVADLRGEQLLRDRRGGRSLALYQPLQRHPDLHRRHAAQRPLEGFARRRAGRVHTARDPDLSGAVTWAPFLVGEFHPTQAVAGVVRNTAGHVQAKNRRAGGEMRPLSPRSSRFPAAAGLA